MSTDGENESRVRSKHTPPSPPSLSSGTESDSDGLVDMELGAARALADFAERALMESRSQEGESSKREPGSGGRRWRKTIESGSGGSPPSSFQGPRKSGSTDEREAKRIRRILANRESARQTIRRRQALRDELTKRVTDLSLDNEKMKMEKELALQEYLSLEDKNQQLKEQIAKSIRSEAEARARIASQKMEVPTSLSTKLPLVVHSRPPFAPYTWPSFPSISPNSRPCCHEDVPPKNRDLKKLFYAPPCSWFYPLIHELSGCCPPYPHVSIDTDEAALHKRRCLSPCSEAMDGIHRTSFCSGSKTDVPLSTAIATEKEKSVIQTNGKPGSPHVEKQMRGSYSDEMILVPSPLKTLNPCSVDEGEPNTNSRDTRNQLLKHHQDSILPDKPQGVCILPRKELMDTSAAAEARKRRKELTKLKRDLHRRHFRMPC